jgi:hypothetical protein
MTENNFIERQSDSAGVGAWSLIEKIERQQLTNDAWRLPTIEQGIISASRGLAVAVGVSVGIAGLLAIGNSLSGITLLAPSVALPVGVVTGVLYTLFDFQNDVSVRYELYRDRLIKQELYQREQAAGVRSVNESVTVEAINRQNNQITYDTFPVSTVELIAIYDAVSFENSKLSKNGIAKILQCSTEKAQNVLESLEKKNYIQYLGSRNSPQGAVFTSKGEMNCRSLWEQSQKALVDAQR